MTPTERVNARNTAPVRPERDHVLYWMIAARRTRHSFGLQRAVERARELGKPLLVLEALRVGYRWASDRHHRFVIDGMLDNREALARAGVSAISYVEPAPGAGAGLLAALAARACVVVTDDSPVFFLPRMVRAAAGALDVRLEAVDGNGLIPLAWHDREYTMAHSFRRQVHKWVRDDGVPALPVAEPLAGYDLGRAEVPAAVRARWPEVVDGPRRDGLASLPIDHAVAPVGFAGGPVAGGAVLERFVDERFERYAVARNEVDDGPASGLSPYLHYGHVGAHEVLSRLWREEDWRGDALDPSFVGKNRGFWGGSEALDAFVDELVTWRGLGFAFAHRRPEAVDRFDALPDWALATLREHADDPRPHVYTHAQLEAGRTHDALWNAAQAQLRAEGRIHNYLRMLWGKKVLEWSPHPEDAMATLVELNNRWAVDGRDPNSSSGIAWIFGRFDRAWGPERPIFGTVRYMSSDSTRRKLRVTDYVDRWTRWSREHPLTEVSPA